MERNLTTVDSVKTFWPPIEKSLNDAQIEIYITRAEILLNQVATLVNNTETVEVLNLATNLLVRRLYLADMHPALASTSAGVAEESAHGLSWRMQRPSDEGNPAIDLVGAEILLLLSPISLGATSAVIMQTERVFHQPLIEARDSEGNKVRLFDQRIDDAPGGLQKVFAPWYAKDGTV